MNKTNLTRAQRIEIKELYAGKALKVSEIAKKFNVNVSTVYRVTHPKGEKTPC